MTPRLAEWQEGLSMIDETHDRTRQSWVASANGHAEFPLQNLPFGVFSPPGNTVPDAQPRGGIAIGDEIFDLRAAHEAAPTFGPCRKLDYELELAIWVGPGNRQGEPVPIGEAGEQIFGLGLVNDWSARDIQQWESQPLGPFLGKSFGSTVSPWIVTAEALEPFRVAQPARPEGDPRPLPHLWDEADQRNGAFDIALESFIRTPAMREKGVEPHRMSHSNTTDLYWTLAQLVAHHTCNGCNLMAGDLFGTGTISGVTPEGY